MKILKLLVAGVAVGIILAAFRDSERHTWLIPLGHDEESADDLEAEPVLGYDGMDVDSLLEWMDSAGLDEGTLRRMRRYEEANLGRETVLTAIEGRL